MRILIVAATEFEVGSLISDFGFRISHVSKSEKESRVPALTIFKSDSDNYRDESPKSEILITGVGMVATAFALGRHLAINDYDLAINLGIAGSVDRNIELGEVVEIKEDILAELGAEDDADFIPIDKLGFGTGMFYPGTCLAELNGNHFNLKRVKAITVNTVHGNEATIKRISDRLNPQLESMEGAAFFYACEQFNIPSLQIRAVSNYVEKRNRDNWKIGLAIKNLNNFASEFFRLYLNSGY